MGTAVAETPAEVVADATPDAPTPPAAAPAATDAPAETPKTATLTTDDAPADAPKKEEGPPDVVYDLKLPENPAIDETALERMTAIARESGLSNEAAQKQVEFLNNEVAAREQAFLASNKPGGADWTIRVNEWETQARKDPEIGGTPEKFAETLTQAKRVLSEVFPPSVAQFLNESGYGSHPDVIRGLAKIAKMTSEGSFIPGTGQATAETDPLRKMYPHPDNYKYQESTT